MEMSDDERDYQTNHSKRKRYDSDNLKEENDSLRHQLEAMRNEMSLERTDLKCNSDFREKQMKVLQETIRNMQTQLLQTKMREQKDVKAIEQLEKRLKEAGVKQLLLKTKIREINEKLRDRGACASVYSESSEIADFDDETVKQSCAKNLDDSQIIDIDVDKSDDEVKIIEDQHAVTETCEKCQEKDKFEELNELEATQETVNPELDKARNPNEKLLPKETETLSLDEAKFIALATAYLLIQPCGSSTQSICEYIKNITKNTQLQEAQLTKILQKYSNIFQADLPVEESPNANDNQHVVWKCCALITHLNS